MTEWTVASIGQLAQIFDGPHATPTKTTTGPWYLSISSLRNGYLDLSESAHLSEKDWPRWTRRVSVQPGDTLFSYETRLGEAAFWKLREPAALGRRMGLLRPRNDVVDARFLTYAYLGPFFQQQIERRAIRGATVDRIPIGEMPQWPIMVPSLPVQRRIAAVLGALDDLIETNERLTAHLLAMVLNVFESRFGSRSLGPSVGDLCLVSDCLHSKKPTRQHEGRLLLQLKNIGTNGQLDVGEQYLISEVDYERWKRPLETTDWDCVITNVGRVGAVARVPAGVKAALGRNMTGIRPNSPRSDGAFVSQALLCGAVRREIELLTDAGTIMNALNVRAIPDIRLPDSTEEERSAFHESVAPLLGMADSLLVESRSLRSSRDALLPLLMSGRISPGEVDLGV